MTSANGTIVPDTMTIPQFAERMQISLSKAYELAQKNELPVPVIRIGRTLRIRRDAYQRWLDLYESHVPDKGREQ